MKRPLIIGLTGGIGMGKSTAAEILRRSGLPVHNADHVVHGLLKRGGAAVARVARLCPESLKRGGIDRKILGAVVFHQPDKLAALERILHPLVRQAEKGFLHQARRMGKRAVVLEIPLLFETGAESRCDVTICVTAPKAVQRERVMQRPGMTAARLRSILARQMPDSERRRRADYVVRTGADIVTLRKDLLSILADLFTPTP